MRFVGTIHAIQLKSTCGARFNSGLNQGSFDVPKVGMARMAGWIWSILAVRLLGRASISLMAPARRTVGLDWINRTMCPHAAHTGTLRGFADQAGPVCHDREPLRHSKRLESRGFARRDARDPSFSVVAVIPDRRRRLSDLMLSKRNQADPVTCPCSRVPTAICPNGWYQVNRPEQPGQSTARVQTHMSYRSYLTNGIPQARRSDGMTSSAGWPASGLSAPDLMVTRSRTRRCPHRRHVVGRPQWAAAVQQRWRT